MIDNMISGGEIRPGMIVTHDPVLILNAETECIPLLLQLFRFE